MMQYATFKGKYEITSKLHWSKHLIKSVEKNF